MEKSDFFSRLHPICTDFLHLCLISLSEYICGCIYDVKGTFSPPVNMNNERRRGWCYSEQGSKDPEKLPDSKVLSESLSLVSVFFVLA